MSKKALSHGLQGERTKPLALFSFVWRKRDCSLKTEYPFDKYLLFVIVISISVSRGTPRPAARLRAITTYSKYRAAPDFAITHKEDNDTPVQSQSERDKTVAGNEGGSVRTTEGWDFLEIEKLSIVSGIPNVTDIEDKFHEKIVWCNESGEGKTIKAISRHKYVYFIAEQT